MPSTASALFAKANSFYKIEQRRGGKVLEEKSCGAVVFVKQDSPIKYLLLSYSELHWDFVKGGVEPNENEKETVIRELKEETSIIDAHFDDGFRESIEYFYYRRGIAVHKVAVFYLMEVYSEKVELSFEHKGYICWITTMH